MATLSQLTDAAQSALSKRDMHAGELQAMMCVKVPATAAKEVCHPTLLLETVLKSEEI